MRSFTHAVTGRTIEVAEGSRLEKLVKGDDNWSEVGSNKKAPAKKTAEPRKRAAAKKAAEPKSEATAPDDADKSE